ncbi:MAG: sce7726 family protein [Butyrivibrio sp.]|nr:sce7726 family protein [Butyrivibrio sp.]
MASDLHDRDIREPLFEFLEDSFGKIRILEEKTMGRSRADIVIVTESGLTGIEIKSDKDTYVRLTSQIKDYDKYYDRNIIVVGSSHALHVEEHVPQYWGIITVEDTGEGLDFYMLRAARDNPKRDMKRKLSLLWRPELFEIQTKMDMPKYKDKSKDFVIEKILSRIPDRISEEELSALISSILFERDYNTVNETLREYRKGELQKAIEAETDPKKKLELMVEKASKAGNFKKKRRRRRR